MMEKRGNGSVENLESAERMWYVKFKVRVLIQN